jgi:alkanesulfonate monooxygenase SsuD/methylene tetrahydromethanopterin reductase-like flavin-dependent oxidoreductase (luciferase family)
MGHGDRFRVRGAYLDEAIRLWRHLWSGSQEPFHGRFHTLDDFVFGPLPDEGAGLPIYVGGRAEAALRRVGRLADGYHSSGTGPAKYRERLPIIRAAAEEAGRPMPVLTARTPVQLGRTDDDGYYAMRGDPAAVAAEIRAFAALGVTHLALWFEATDPAGIVVAAERFHVEVEPLV